MVKIEGVAGSTSKGQSQPQLDSENGPGPDTHHANTVGFHRQVFAQFCSLLYVHVDLDQLACHGSSSSSSILFPFCVTCEPVVIKVFRLTEELERLQMELRQTLAFISVTIVQSKSTSKTQFGQPRSGSNVIRQRHTRSKTPAQNSSIKCVGNEPTGQIPIQDSGQTEVNDVDVDMDMNGTGIASQIRNLRHTICSREACCWDSQQQASRE
jgi:hypothetical protein